MNDQIILSECGGTPWTALHSRLTLAIYLISPGPQHTNVFISTFRDVNLVLFHVSLCVNITNHTTNMQIPEAQEPHLTMFINIICLPIAQRAFLAIDR